MRTMNDPASPENVLDSIGGVFSGTAMVLESDGTVVDVVGSGRGVRHVRIDDSLVKGRRRHSGPEPAHL